AAWWERQKATMVVVISDPPYVSGSRQVTCRGQESDPAEGLPEAACFDHDGFRGLLNRLGVAVSVFWQKTKKKVANPQWDLDFASLQIDLSWETKHVSVQPTYQ